MNMFLICTEPEGNLIFWEGGSFLAKDTRKSIMRWIAHLE